jgi:hypothetical protein
VQHKSQLPVNAQCGGANQANSGEKKESNFDYGRTDLSYAENRCFKAL